MTASSFLSLCQIFTGMLLRSHMQVFSCIREASELSGSVNCASFFCPGNTKSWLHAHSTFVSFVFCCSSSPRQHMNSDSTEAEVLMHNKEPVTSKLSRLVTLKYAPCFLRVWCRSSRLFGFQPAACWVIFLTVSLSRTRDEG